jgi:hypothetical protein
VIVRTYLVIAPGRGGRPRVSRATVGRPYLDSDEAMIALVLEIPDDIFEAPLFTVQVEKRQIQVAVEAEDVEEPSVEEAS